MNTDRAKPINWQDEPAAVAEESISSFKKKAEHNKFESQLTLLIGILSSLLVPVFLAVGDDKLFDKILPAVFSAVSSFCTLWYTTRKPHILWTSYRRKQREIERELFKYNQEIDEYEKTENKTKLLASRLNSIFQSSHDEWESNIPNSLSANAEK